MERPIEITVGGNIIQDGQVIGAGPAAGQADCLLPMWAGFDVVIQRRGVGPYTGSEYSVLAGGGFLLLNGDLFADGDLWFAYKGGVITADEVASYTNGFNLPQVMAAMIGRLGWRAGTIAESPVPDLANTTSRSGRYFNDFHALCSLYTIKKIMEDPQANDATVNLYLRALNRATVMQALNGVLNEPEFIELRTDFDRDGEQNDRPINNGNLFVGRRITPARLPDVSIQVDSVGLLFDRDVTFPLYLFQEGRKSPIWTADVTAVGEEKTLVNLPDIVLNYLGSGHFGGAYYLGYFQEDLGDAKAIDESRCGWNIANNWGLDFIQSTKIAGQPNFDRRIISGSPYSNGLNFQFTAFKDWTNWIIKKANVFDELIGLQMVVKVIELALHCVRSNPEERILKGQLEQAGLWQQLDGSAPGVPDAPKIAGLRDRIAREVARVKKSFYPYHRAINYASDDCNDN